VFAMTQGVIRCALEVTADHQRASGVTRFGGRRRLVGSYSSTPCVRASAKIKAALPLPSMSTTLHPTVEISGSSGTAVIGRGSANHVTTGRLQRSEAVAAQCCTTSMGCQ
jgi:hypothetical protein